jgi:excisionase family DNA binding protein
MTTNITAGLITPLYYTPRQVAKRCGCSLSFVYAKMASGDILAVRPFVTGPLRVPRAWLDTHLEQIEKEAVERSAIDPAVHPTREMGIAPRVNKRGDRVV